MKRRAFIKQSAFAGLGLIADPGILPRKINTNSFSLEEKAVRAPHQAEDLHVLELAGPPKQRGYIYGESLREKIRAQIDVWKDKIGQNQKTNPEIYIKRFLEETNFKSAIKKWTPDLLEEVKGISEGSGLPFKEVYAFQLWDEEWWYSWYRNSGISIKERRHCTIGGAFDQVGIPPILGANMDLPGWTDGFGVLLRIKHTHSSLESYVFTVAGFLAVCGVNNKAIGLSCNTVLGLNCHSHGLPFVYIARSLLEKTKYTDAVRFLSSINHASGQNYCIGGLQEVSAYECSANKVCRYIPYPGAKVIYHTNHPLINDDQSIYEEIKRRSNASEDKAPGSSEMRLRAMEKRLKNSKIPITVDTFKEALSSRDNPKYPVCYTKPEKGKGNGQRCLIYELSDSPTLHIAPGPPCTTGFKSFRF